MTIFVSFMRVWVCLIVSMGMEPLSRHQWNKIVDEVLALPERTRMQILAPIVRRRKGQHKAIFERVQKDGCSCSCGW